MTKTQKVVTWQSPSGQAINICRKCEQRLRSSNSWPKDSQGQEYCQVSHGLHTSVCHTCDRLAVID